MAKEKANNGMFQHPGMLVDMIDLAHKSGADEMESGLRDLLGRQFGIRISYMGEKGEKGEKPAPEEVAASE